MQARRLSRIAAAFAFAALTVACGNSTTTPSTVSSVAVTGTAPALGATAQFSAMAVMADGTSLDVTSLALWSTTDAADATVSSTGLVTGVGAGTVAVQATYQSVTGSEQITLGQ